MDPSAELDIEAWLAGLGLGQYAVRFQENDIDGSILAELTADDLRDIGVASVGHRRRLLSAIAQMAETAGLDGPRGLQDVAPPESVAERRMLTVMFCDLAESTALSVRADPEDFAEFVGSFRSTVERTVAPFQAHVAQYAGDGVLIYFGYPDSSDHDAERSVEAAFAVVEAVAKLPDFAGGRPRVRIGIATGLTVVGGIGRERETLGETALGETINLAARLQGLADLDGIVIASSTRRLVGNLFDCRDLGDHQLKGFSVPVAAWQIEGRVRLASRFDALRAGQATDVFVGRDAELALLRERADAGGPTQVFLIEGDAGVGKSRLAREAVRQASGGQESMFILQCSPYHVGSPFYPVRYLLERHSGIAAADAPEIGLERLRTALAGFGDISDTALAVLADVLGIASVTGATVGGFTALTRREFALRHMTELLCKTLVQRPFLIVEDIQWIDPSTSELLDATFAAAEASGAKVIATSRPQAVPAWLGRHGVATIKLDGLSQRNTRALVRGILGDGGDEGIVDAIVERSDGVPIFAEELARAYLAQGADDLGGAVAAIPATLVETVQSRMDRLPNGRRIASIAAAIGRELPTAVLRAVSGLSENVVSAGVRELQDAAIFAPGYSPFGEAIRFRQMLLRDAAYGLILKRDRQALHARIAGVLRDTFPEIKDAMPNVMAMQLGLAGAFEEATREWERAGDLALRRSAYAEAVSHLREALASNARLPPSPERDSTDLALRTALFGALIPVRGYNDPEVVDEADRVAELGKKQVSGQSVVAALHAKWVVLGSSGNVDANLKLAQSMREIARSGTEIDRLIAQRCYATTLLHNARISDAVQAFHDFLELYEPDRHGDALRTMHSDHALMVTLGLAEAYTLAADREAAWTWRARALETARLARRAHDLGHVLAFGGCLHAMLLGDLEECGRRARELVDVAEAHDLTFWRGHGRLFAGLCLIEEGQTEAGFSEARGGVAELLETSAFSNCWYILMARACVRHGHLSEAGDMLGYAQRSMDQGDLRFAPEYHRVQALLLQAQGAPHKEVRDVLLRARDLAVSFGTHLFLSAIDADEAWAEAG